MKEWLKKRSDFSKNNLLRDIKNVFTYRKQILFMYIPFHFDNLLEWLCLLFQKNIWSWQIVAQNLISDCTRTLSTCIYNICCGNCLIMYGLPQLTATCNTTSERTRNFIVALGWRYRVYDSRDNCSHSF